MSDGRAVIFDMDGVLIDSYDAHFESWQRLSKERGVTYPEETFAIGFGRTSHEVFRELWPEKNLSEKQIVVLAERKEELFREALDRDFPAMDGVAELIEALNKAGWRTAIGSSGPPENVKLVADRLGVTKLMGALVTMNEVKRGKPDPQVFLVAAEKLGVDPKRCIVIEDAPVGIQAAHAAGMACVGICSTGRRRDQLQEAELVIDSMREISPPRLEELQDTFLRLAASGRRSESSPTEGRR